MSRPCVIDPQRFDVLYQKGLPDTIIAQQMAVDRAAVWRYRKKHGLPAHRQRGNRGPTFKENEAYALAAARAVKHVAPYINTAIRQMPTTPEQRFVACGMYPKPLTHPNILPYTADPSKITPQQALKIAQIEIKHEMSGICGVPGCAVIELAQVYKTAAPEIISQLSREAVREAGFIADSATVSEVLRGRRIVPAEEMVSFWKETLSNVQRWAPAADKPKHLPKFRGTVAQTMSYSKAKRRTAYNTEVNRACLAAKGY